MWYKRPCPVPLLKVMALSAIHLQPLRLVLLDTFMTDYITLVDSYLCSRQYEPGELEHVSMVGSSQMSTCPGHKELFIYGPAAGRTADYSFKNSHRLCYIQF